jgi:hypothetical protein
MQSTPLVVRARAGDGGIVARRFGPETLLVPVCAGVGDLDNVYTLNAVGTTIWDLIAEPTPIEELAAAIAAEYDVDAGQARRDLDAFLEDLGRLGLVSVLASV